MSRALAVDGQAEVVSEGESETAGQNVIVSATGTGELRFRAPGSAAVGRAAVKGIPQPDFGVDGLGGPGIHPRDANIARCASDNRRKAVLHTRWRRRNARPRSPACPARGGRRKINPLWAAADVPGVPQSVERASCIRCQRDLCAEKAHLTT